MCSVDNYNVLEPSYIKPFNLCEAKEKYDFDNGILLCANHHKLFNKGLFTFDINHQMEIMISKKVNEKDKDFFFKQYDVLNKPLNLSLSENNKYMKYHIDHIFNK